MAAHGLFSPKLEINGQLYRLEPLEGTQGLIVRKEGSWGSGEPYVLLPRPQGRLDCTCPAYTYSGKKQECKHVNAILAWKALLLQATGSNTLLIPSLAEESV